MKSNLRQLQFIFFASLIYVHWNIAPADGNLAISKYDVQIINYGLFEFHGKTVTVPRKNAPHEKDQLAFAPDFEHIRKTETIPLEKGLTFGLHWKVSGLTVGKPYKITDRIIHPTIVGPTGKSSTGSERTRTLIPEKRSWDSALLHKFSEDYELVPGQWQIVILINDEIVMQKKFNVIKKK